MKALLNWRYYVLFLLGFVATVGIFGVPDDNSPTWLGDLIFSKVIGFGAGYIVCKLVGYWSKRNLIPEFDEITKDEEDDLWE
jgi:hypothetical protein